MAKIESDGNKSYLLFYFIITTVHVVHVAHTIN